MEADSLPSELPAYSFLKGVFYLFVKWPIIYLDSLLLMNSDFPGGSDGRVSAYNAGDPSSIPGLGRSPREGISHPSSILELPWCLDSKESACNVGDLGSIPGLGRSSGEGYGNPLQYSCLENPMDKGAWQGTVHGVAKSQA